MHVVLSYTPGRKVILVTDHKPLVTVLGPKKVIPPLSAARLQRWAIILAAYSCDIEWRPTHQHANIDGLSCLPVEAGTGDLDEANIFNVAQISALLVTSKEVES